MKNIYYERIDEMKQLYAELAAQPENTLKKLRDFDNLVSENPIVDECERLRVEFLSVFNVIYDYFHEMFKVPDAMTDDDRNDAIAFKYFLDSLDSEVTTGKFLNNDWISPWESE